MAVTAFIAPAAIDLICGFEGYHKRLADDRAAPYLCPAYVPTIGYGSIWRADGTRVAMTDPPITRAEAMELMRRELRLKCVPAVEKLTSASIYRPLMHGALVSFTYNLGGGALAASGLRRAVNDRRWADVPGELAKWRMAGGRVLAGLARRRAAEAGNVHGRRAGVARPGAEPGRDRGVDAAASARGLNQGQPHE